MEALAPAVAAGRVAQGSGGSIALCHEMTMHLSVNASIEKRPACVLTKRVPNAVHNRSFQMQTGLQIVIVLDVVATQTSNLSVNYHKFRM